MRVHVEWSAAARRDLADIEDFIALDDPGAAARWVLRLVECAASAAHVPMASRAFSPLRREDVREVFLRRYRLIFQIRANAILVLRVLHGARRVQAGDVATFEPDD